MEAHRVFLAVLSAVLLRSCAGQECPVVDDECVNIELPNPEDCSSYIMCDFCQAVIVPCVDGTYEPINARCVTGRDRWCEVSETAFTAAPFTDAVGPQNPFVLKKQVINHGADYHTISGYYTAPFNGTYFFQLTMGSVPNAAVDCVINGLRSDQGVYADTTIGYDVLSRSTIVQLQANIETSLDLRVDSSVQGNRTVWSGFRIEDFMDPVCALGASIISSPQQFSTSEFSTSVFPTSTAPAVDLAKITAQTDSSDVPTQEGTAEVTGPTELPTDGQQPTTAAIPFQGIPFDNVEVDCNGAYSPSIGVFTVPEGGLYFVSFSTGIITNVKTNITINVNNATVLLLTKNEEDLEAVNTMSTSALLRLEADDALFVESIDGQLVNSINNALISFSVLRYAYQPVDESQAWSVQRKTQFTGPGQIEFDDHIINEDNLYNIALNVIEIGTSGYYVVTLNAGYETSSTTFELQLEKYVFDTDTEVVMDIFKTDILSKGTISRTSLLFLQAGENLRVTLVQGAISETSFLETSFHGWLLKRFTPPPA